MLTFDKSQHVRHRHTKIIERGYKLSFYEYLGILYANKRGCGPVLGEIMLMMDD